MGLDVAGKGIVITGASRGLGHCLATAAREAGARVAVCARSMPDVPGAYCAAVDVGDPEALDAFASEATTRLGSLHAWVNNAGMLGAVGPLRTLPLDQMQRVLEVNLLGVIVGSAAFARHLHARDGEGVLLNISSGAAKKPYPGWSLYGTTKAGLELLTATIAAEEPRLRAHAVAPGVVATDMQVEVRAATPEQFPSVDRFHALHRDGLLRDPVVVARELLHLAFDPDWAGAPLSLRLPWTLSPPG